MRSMACARHCCCSRISSRVVMPASTPKRAGSKARIIHHGAPMVAANPLSELSDSELELRLERLSRELEAAANPRERKQLILELTHCDEAFKARLGGIGRVRLARNPLRPQTADYIEGL